MTQDIRSLTGLRGVAAVYVVVYHMLQGSQGQGITWTIAQHGYIAVDLFFVLSGFVMAMVHGDDRFDRAGVGAFLRKRLARVYPLYAAVTLATLALCVADHIPISPGRVAANALLVQGWGLGTAIVAPSWSLSAEIGAYLLFPMLVPPILRKGRATALIGVACALALLVLLSLGGPHPRSGPLDLYQPGSPAPLLRGAAGFVLGLGAFRLSRDQAFRRMAEAGASTALLLGLLVLLAWPSTDVAIVALAAVLIATLGVGQIGLADRLLGAPLPHRLGVLSYSIYLVHYPLRDWLLPVVADSLRGFGASHADALATLATCAATLAVATLTYRLIETPARSMVRTHLRLASTAS